MRIENEKEQNDSGKKSLEKSNCDLSAYIAYFDELTDQAKRSLADERAEQEKNSGGSNPTSIKLKNAVYAVVAWKLRICISIPA